MSNSDLPPLRRRRPSFTPRFTISILYLLFFFVVFSFLMVLPDLLAILGTEATDSELEQAAKEATQAGFQWQIALLASLAVTACGARYKFLPGLRPR